MMNQIRSFNSEKKSDDKKSDDKKSDDKKPEVDSSEIITENNAPKTD